jgi:hypothetical protein
MPIIPDAKQPQMASTGSSVRRTFRPAGTGEDRLNASRPFIVAALPWEAL